MIEGQIWAKRKKQVELEKSALIEKELANRKFSSMRWNFDLIKTFMINRAKDIFKHPFILDEKNENSFNLLCYYFIGDESNFHKLAYEMDVDNASLNKGILLAGNFGSGKTVLMQLFAKNSKQVYFIRAAKKIANDFSNSEDKKIPQEYLEPYKNAINDPATMFQPLSGLCIDDIGSEQVKNNYGNKSNVIGDLIEERYYSKYYGLFLHGTTNLSAQELKDYYGDRVVSRMREIFNFIELKGDDRRK